MEAITREEMLLSGKPLEPITRKELFLAKAAGMDVQTPEPITREEMFLSMIQGGSGGGSDPVIEPLSVTENGTYEAPDGVDGYSPLTVNVASSGSEMDTDFIAAVERTATKITIPYGCTKIGEYAFYGYKNAVINMPDTVITVCGNAFGNCPGATVYLAHSIKTLEKNAFAQFKSGLPWLPDELDTIGELAFNGGIINEQYLIIPQKVRAIGNRAFQNCTGLREVTFLSKNVLDGNTALFNGCTNLITINVPWAEGEVASAPWGATNATINYNYTGG